MLELYASKPFVLLAHLTLPGTGLICEFAGLFDLVHYICAFVGLYIVA